MGTNRTSLRSDARHLSADGCSNTTQRSWRLEARTGLASRVAPDDLRQQTFLDLARRIDEYLADTAVTFYAWLRFPAVQRMQVVHRTHLAARMRSVTQEAALPVGGVALASAESMAGQLVSQMTSPSQAAIRHELQARLRAALDEMDALDREVLALRHF